MESVAAGSMGVFEACVISIDSGCPRVLVGSAEYVLSAGISGCVEVCEVCRGL